jgi:hypothetical protein
VANMAIQLEFNIDDQSELEIKLGHMQKKLDEMVESMGKVRRKLFSEMTEIKKQNLVLKLKLEEITHVNPTWIYGQSDSLFSRS